MTTRPTAPLLLAALSLAAPARAGDDTLEARLRPLIDRHEGKVAVVVEDLTTGETFAENPDVPMPTASLIKFPVMIEAYRQAAEGTLDLDRTVTLEADDKVPGSGILTDHFSPGASFPLRDAVHLMIVFSDNTATNLVLDEIGIGATAATMERMGYPNTKIHSKVYRRDTSVFPERSKEFGLGSTTAAEMVRLCKALHRRELVSPEASEAMYAHMLQCDDKEKFPRFLPPGTKVAFKTGSVDASRTAAGILETPAGPVALCVLTSENRDQSWTPDNAGNRLCAEIAREVYGYYESRARRDGSDDARPGDPNPQGR
jgi:beta-lactamase class A